MTKIVNKDQPMTLFGEKTPRAVIYKSESHKLHQAFCVKDGENNFARYAGSSWRRRFN